MKGSHSRPYYLTPSLLLRALSFPASYLYGAVLARLRSPAPVDVGVPVISVGNIHAGGVGKTPLVIELARRFSGEGRRVAVVSRGYRGSLSKLGAAVTASSLAAEVGDEPIEIARAVPEAKVYIGANRVEAARRAAAEADLIILDDGFQHRALARSHDLVVVPAEADPMRERLLPLGRLREPLSSLKRATHLVIMREPGAVEDYAPNWEALAEGKSTICEKSCTAHAISPDGKLGGSIDLKERNVFAFSGIANPERFHRALASAGARVIDAYTRGDHHVFSRDELDRVKKSARSRDALPITTIKDLSRIGAPGFDTACLRIVLDCSSIQLR